MAFAKLVAFDRPLAGVSAPGLANRLYTEAEVAKATQAAYQRGVTVVPEAHLRAINDYLKRST